MPSLHQRRNGSDNGENNTPLTSSYCYFPIWAEENGNISANFQFAFGNGDNTPSRHGIPLLWDCELIGMTMDVEGAGPVTLEAHINGSGIVESRITGNDGSTVLNFEDNPIAVSAGSPLTFRTVSDVGNQSSARICAWFRKPN